MEEMKDCNAFYLYKDDIEVKNAFFIAMETLDTFSCYVNEPNR